MTKKKKQKKKNYLFIFFSVILCLITLLLSYIIFGTNLLKPKLNEETTSYISFNNKDTTDILKIKNIQIMSNEKGKSNRN